MTVIPLATSPPRPLRRCRRGGGPGRIRPERAAYARDRRLDRGPASLARLVEVHVHREQLVGRCIVPIRQQAVHGLDRALRGSQRDEGTPRRRIGEDEFAQRIAGRRAHRCVAQAAERDHAQTRGQMPSHV